jgi:hypothetical protein
MGAAFWHTLAMSEQREQAADKSAPEALRPDTNETDAAARIRPREIGGPSGPEPTRFGDWERKGRCIDF